MRLKATKLSDAELQFFQDNAHRKAFVRARLEDDYLPDDDKSSGVLITCLPDDTVLVVGVDIPVLIVDALSRVSPAHITNAALSDILLWKLRATNPHIENIIIAAYTRAIESLTPEELEQVIKSHKAKQATQTP